VKNLSANDRLGHDIHYKKKKKKTMIASQIISITNFYLRLLHSATFVTNRLCSIIRTNVVHFVHFIKIDKCLKKYK